MNKVKAVQQFFHDGMKLECVENTFRPELNGTTRTILRAGATVCDTEVDGRSFRMELPKRASWVLDVAEDSVTYRINEKGDTVTLRRVSHASL